MNVQNTAAARVPVDAVGGLIADAMAHAGLPAADVAKVRN